MLTVETLVEKIDELKALMDTIRSSNSEPKVNVDKLIEQFDEDQLENYKKIMDLVQKVDRLIHTNFDSSVAQAVNASLKVVSADSIARTNFLVDVDNRAKKLELDGDVVEMIEEAKKVKKQVEALHDYLVASGEEVPQSVYKTDEKGKLVLTKAGNKVLDLPRIFDVDDSETGSKRGRPSKSKTLILGTVNGTLGDNNEFIPDFDDITWHDNDHIGKTFQEIYGTIRTTHNPIGLFKACDKANIEVTKGWDTPVEYAGRLWVAKVRS